jgi:glutaredoxin
MRVVTLYSKPGCHLCDVVEQTIARVRQQIAFDFAKRNILDDPIDERRYREAIPVICVDGQEIARHRLSDQTLRAALQPNAPRV